MKKLAIVMLSLCLTLVPVLTLADSVLRVQGTAEIAVKPNRAEMTVGYAAENSDAKAAQQEVTAAIDAIISAALAEDIDESDIKTAYLNMYPTYVYQGNESKVSGYRVEHMLQISINDLSKLGAVLDAVLAAGANQANSINYGSSEEDAAYLQAMAKAVERATLKAESLAIASGVWLGKLDQINEITSSYSSLFRTSISYDMAGASTASFGSSVLAGDLMISATVELVYQVR